MGTGRPVGQSTKPPNCPHTPGLWTAAKPDLPRPKTDLPRPKPDLPRPKPDLPRPLGRVVVWNIADAVVDRDKRSIAAIALEFIQESRRLRVHILQGRTGGFP